MPPATLLIENPGAIVEDMAKKHGNRELALAFIEFVKSENGQRILAEYGFRPKQGKGERSPGSPAKLFTMDDLGGWERVKKQLDGYRLGSTMIVSSREALAR